MKKTNYKIIAFILSTLLIVTGWFSNQMLRDLKNSLINFIKAPNIEILIENVNSITQDISYKTSLIDLYSLYYRITDTKMVEKPDRTILRLKNDFLSFKKEALTEETINELADSTASLKSLADELNAPFLYVMIPPKLYFEDSDINTPNITYQNCMNLYHALEQRGINLLNLGDKMIAQNMTMESSYFITDHHWLPETGFWAFGELCQKLNADYHFTYDENLLNLENYNVEKYEDCFLGSVGKKVGRYFTPLGLDDFSLITPKFQTQLKVCDSMGIFTGEFKDSIIDISRLTNESLYKNNPYGAYSRGDFGKQVIYNQLADNTGKEIVIIRDSFSCPVTPFLALTTKTLHVLDPRYWEPTEEAETISEYIKDVNPDFIIVCYSSITSEMFNF